MSHFMFLLVVLLQLELYISFASALPTTNHQVHVDQNTAPLQSTTARVAPIIRTSIASHVIDGLSGRVLNLGNVLPRDDKMDDLFYSHESNSIADRKDDADDRGHEPDRAERKKSAINRLPMGDLTKTVELDQLGDNTLDEPEMVINNHQVTTDSSVPVTAISRHYNSYQLNSNVLFTNGHHHNHGSHHYGKYSPNMFANNYNLNYIHSFLTSKPSMSSAASLSLQTMQSLLNSNPNGLSLPSYGSPVSSQTGNTYVSASSALSAAAHQPTSAHSIKGQQIYYYSSLDNNNVTQQIQSTPAPPPLPADYSNLSHCGRQQVAYREPRIVGGNNTYEGEFPWAVSIQRHRNHHCGGVIVGHRWILTAAHCVRNQLVGNLIVRTGGHTLSRSINSINGHLEKDLPVEQIIIHDDFSRYDNLTSSQMKSSANTNNADIALLKLKEDIRWNEHAWPVCFPSQDAGNFSGHEAIVIGWGKLNEKSEEFSNELQKVKVTIIDNKVCQNWFRQAGRDMPIDDRIICAGFKSGGKDACHGDSGGPLLSRLNGQYAVVGVVSTGIGCARPLLPGLYSRVSSYIGWIERYINN